MGAVQCSFLMTRLLGGIVLLFLGRLSYPLISDATLIQFGKSLYEGGKNFVEEVKESNNSTPTTLSEKVSITPVKSIWKCPECTSEEKYVLEQLQEKTNIKDRNSLATIMGNIQQESKFIPNICEGGARVPYDRCHRGGYGIIQWTTENRYRGLGNFANRYNCDPSALDCQTRYMISESVFVKTLPSFEKSGYSVSHYMKPAYRWLGWGIKGKREIYSHQYTNKLVLS